MSAHTNPINNLYRTLVAGNGPLDAVTQAAIARHGTSTADQVLLVALLRRDDLDADVDRSLGDCEAPKVRAAWLSRRGRTRDDVDERLVDESRATVLAAVAADVGTPVDLLDRLTHDGRRSVLEALLANPSAPDGAIVESVSRLGEHPRNYRVVSLIASRLEERPDLHDRIARNCGPQVAHHLLRTGSLLSRGSLKRIADLLVVRPLERAAEQVLTNPKLLQPSRWGAGTRSYNEVLVSLDSIERLAAQPAFDLDLLRDAGTSWDSICSTMTAAGSSAATPGPIGINVFNALAGDEQAERNLRQYRARRDLDVIATTRDPSTLGEAVTAAMTERHQVGLFSSLLANPHLRLNHLVHFSGECPEFRVGGEFHEAGFMQLFLRAVANEQSEPATDTGETQDPLDWSKHARYGGRLATRGGPQQVLVRLQQVLDALPSDPDAVYDGFVDGAPYQAWVLDAVVEDRTHCRAVLRRLGADTLSRLLERRPELSAQVASMLSDILGDDPETWKTFAALSGDSVLSVVDTARAAVRLHR